ncbi:hypothetical protein ACVIWU_006482 [Bradyrhizobium sp. USDA 4509]
MGEAAGDGWFLLTSWLNQVERFCVLIILRSALYAVAPSNPPLSASKK